MNIEKLFEIVSKEWYSDIHICEDKQVAVRDHSWNIKRLDYILDRDEIFWFANKINNPDQIDALLQWEEIDNAYTWEWSRYRINIYFDMNWINMALRRIPQKVPTMEKIDLPEHIKQILHKDRWLILVTWPTGSGKSTTVASLIDYINHNLEKHIITLEDPIEFVFEEDKCLINQRNVGSNTLSWSRGIKYALRQDPDIIMVGEMRDLETIQSALTLVETWHLVISTLHTINAPQTISRIIDAFPANKQNMIATQLSLSLEMIISQRLIERKDKKWRVAAREIMLADPAISNLIRENKIAQIFSVLETSLNKWMISMDHSLAKLVAKNIVDLKTIIPYIRNKSTFKDLVKLYANSK
jgi:twitching motility protein PilT